MDTRTADGSLRGTALILDLMPERVIQYRVNDLLIIYCNESWAAGHGVHPSSVIGRTLDEFLSAAERIGLRAQCSRLSVREPVIIDATPRPAPNAPGHWVEWVDRYLPDEDGGQILAVGRDVTGRYLAERNLAASEVRFRTLADASADVVWRFVTDPVPHFEYMSPSVEKILGFPPAIFLHDFTRFLDILDDDGRAMILRALRGDPMPERFDLRFRSADGSVMIGEAQTTLVVGGIQGVTRDVTELRALQADLASLAMRDPLTGLANRRMLDELVEMRRSEPKARAPLALVYIDLDHFKVVNDTYGHDAGDSVLCETARRLRATVRNSDVVARVGGDEFVILYEMNDSTWQNLVPRIERALAPPIEISERQTVWCAASIGHAETTPLVSSLGELLAAADAQMYVQKKARGAGAMHLGHLRRAHQDAYSA